MKLLRRDYSPREALVILGSLPRLASSPKRILNLMKAGLSSFLKLESSLGMPVDLFVEVTGRCNYRCVKCGRTNERYRDDGPVDGGMNLPFEQYKRIIDELGETLVTLRLWHYGEPLLHPDLNAMIEYARARGVVVAVSTNASLMDEKASLGLVESGLDYLIVSFDGASPGTYQRLHGLDRFDRVVANLRGLVALRKRSRSTRPFIDLQFIVMKGNEDEVDRARDLARKIGVDKLTLLRLDDRDVGFHVFPGIETPSDIVPEDSRNRYGPERVNGSRVCTLPWKEAVVRYSGTVLPCVCDLGQAHSAGRLFGTDGNRSFRSIWNGPAFCEFRRKTASNDGSVAMCEGCVQRNNNNEDQIE